MAQIKDLIIKIILSMILVSIVMMYVSTPFSYGALELGKDEFYYSGVAEGKYTETKGIFERIIDALKDVADWILGLLTMAGRMIFVGWTALIEHMLTWALESTAGVNLDGSDISATDLTALSDSSNNVTVQAIVYNMVPALDVNFFKFNSGNVYELDDGNVKSPTGNLLVCEKCHLPVKQCCTKAESQDTVTIDGDYCDTSKSGANCTCHGKCAACKMYKQLLMNKGKLPIIMQFKRLVAMWYRVIFLLSVAAMLLVLIALGIKMAVASLASEKAKYKNMLVDWVVGMIIIFTIQMIMYAAIVFCEMTVDMVRKAGNEVNRHEINNMSMTEQNPDDMNSDGTKIISNQEIEIDVYEELRTRAYDPKLTVGMTGMIMYMAMVYYAVRYTFMYLRRLLTLSILTIMAPAVGVGYAFQKVFTGRQMSFKKWLQEYILSLFIQVIHAIIYAVFISQALVFSLQSISGMLFALVLIHYAFTLDKLFRKVFNFSSKSLGDMDKAADVRGKMNAARDVALGGRKVVNAMSNTLYAKGVKTAAKVAGSAAVMGTAALIAGGKNAMSAVGDREDHDSGGDYDTSYDSTDEEDISPMSQALGGESRPLSSGETESADEFSSAIDTARRNQERRTQADEDRELLDFVGEDGSYTEEDRKAKHDRLLEEFIKANEIFEREPTDANKASVANAQRRLNRFNELTKNPSSNHDYYSMLDVLRGRVSQVFNVDTYIEKLPDRLNADGTRSPGGFRFKTKTSGVNGKSKLKNIKDAFVGSTAINPITGKKEVLNEGAYAQLLPKNFLNMSPAEINSFKKNVLQPFKDGLIGIPMTFLGVMTLVDNPQLGLGLIAMGRRKKEKGKKTLGLSRADRKYAKRYTFSRFSPRTMANMATMMLNQAEFEHDKMVVENLKSRHRELFNKLRNMSYEDFKKDAMMREMYGHIDSEEQFRELQKKVLEQLQARKNRPYALNTPDEDFLMDEHEFYRNPELLSASQLLGDRVARAHVQSRRFLRMDRVGSGLNQFYMDIAREEKKQRKKVQEDRLRFLVADAEAELDVAIERQNDVMRRDLYAERGFAYDTRTKKIRNFDIDEEFKKTERGIKSKKTTKKGEKLFSDADKQTIHREITHAVLKLSTSGKEFDPSSKKYMREAIATAEESLQGMGIIAEGESLESLFEGGRKDLQKEIREKTELHMELKGRAKRAVLGVRDVSEEEMQAVMDSVDEVRGELLDIVRDPKKKFALFESSSQGGGIRQGAKIRPRVYVSKKGKRKTSVEMRASFLKKKKKKNSEVTQSDMVKYLAAVKVLDDDRRAKEAQTGKKGQSRYAPIPIHTKKEVKKAKEELKSIGSRRVEILDGVMRDFVRDPERMKVLFDSTTGRSSSKQKAESKTREFVRRDGTKTTFSEMRESFLHKVQKKETRVTASDMEEYLAAITVLSDDRRARGVSFTYGIESGRSQATGIPVHSRKEIVKARDTLRRMDSRKVKALDSVMRDLESEHRAERKPREFVRSDGTKKTSTEMRSLFLQKVQRQDTRVTESDMERYLSATEVLEADKRSKEKVRKSITTLSGIDKEKRDVLNGVMVELGEDKAKDIIQSTTGKATKSSSQKTREEFVKKVKKQNPEITQDEIDGYLSAMKEMQVTRRPSKTSKAPVRSVVETIQAVEILSSMDSSKRDALDKVIGSEFDEEEARFIRQSPTEEVEEPSREEIFERARRQNPQIKQSDVDRYLVARKVMDDERRSMEASGTSSTTDEIEDQPEPVQDRSSEEVLQAIEKLRSMDSSKKRAIEEVLGTDFDEEEVKFMLQSSAEEEEVSDREAFYEMARRQDSQIKQSDVDRYLRARKVVEEDSHFREEMSAGDSESQSEVEPVHSREEIREAMETLSSMDSRKRKALEEVMSRDFSEDESRFIMQSPFERVEETSSGDVAEEMRTMLIERVMEQNPEVTQREIEEFLTDRKIIEVTSSERQENRRKAIAKKLTYSREEIQEAEERLESLDVEKRETMERAMADTMREVERVDEAVVLGRVLTKLSVSEDDGERVQKYESLVEKFVETVDPSPSAKKSSKRISEEDASAQVETEMRKRKARQAALTDEVFMGHETKARDLIRQTSSSERQRRAMEEVVDKSSYLNELIAQVNLEAVRLNIKKPKKELISKKKILENIRSTKPRPKI